jgi:hypothetical protein
MAAHASTATAAEIAKRPSGSGFEHLFEDTCDVDAVGDEAVRELTPKRLKTDESRSLALVTQSEVRTVIDVPTSVTTAAASTVAPPLPLSGVAHSLSATIPFEVLPPPVAIQQGLDADMMLNFQRVLANQAHMQQQQMAVMVQLFEAVSRMTTNVPQIPVQTVGVGPSATLSGTTHCTVSDAELELHIRSAPVVSATTLSNECLKHLLKVTNTFEKTLQNKTRQKDSLRMLSKMLLQWLVIPVIIHLVHVPFVPLRMDLSWINHLMLLLVKRLRLWCPFPWGHHDVMLCKGFIMPVH